MLTRCLGLLLMVLPFVALFALAVEIYGWDSVWKGLLIEATVLALVAAVALCLAAGWTLFKHGDEEE